MLSSKRININGIWYVEDTNQSNNVHAVLKSNMLTNDDVTKIIQYIYETDSFCWIASKCFKSNHTDIYDDFYIEYTDKRSGKRDTWVTEHWDNMAWFRELKKKQVDTPYNEAVATMGSEGTDVFILFLEYLDKQGWL